MSSSSGSEWNQLKLQLEREFFAGGIAGSVGIFIGYPLDMVKIKLQVFPDQYKSATQCLRQAIKEEGFVGLYKGCLPPILIQGLINSLMFVGESLATKVLEPNLKPGDVGSVSNAVLAGACGGVLQCVALVPSEVVKCTMQTETMSASTQKHSEFQRTISCARKILQNEGIFGLYRGWTATVLREAPSIGMYFCSYKYSKSFLTQIQGLKEANDASIMLAGGIAGALSWTTVYPFDVIKSTIQSNNSGSENRGILSTARVLYQRHGHSVFFRGLGTTIVRAFPVNASTFFCYEKLKHFFHLEHQKEDGEFDGLFRDK
jgi:solute carrier family 25 carnitine/acylcarnitine transporter 20/29